MIGTIISVTAVLIGLYIILTVQSGNQNAFASLADPLSKTFNSIIVTLQGRSQ